MTLDHDSVPAKTRMLDGGLSFKAKLLVAVTVVAWANYACVLWFNTLTIHWLVGILISFAMGCFSSEVSMIAVIVGLARGAGWRRVAFAIATTLFWLFGFLFALKTIDQSVQLEIIVVSMLVAFVAIALYQIPIWLFRVGTGRCLKHRCYPLAAKSVAHQFQIRDVLIVTTALALAISATKLILDNATGTGFALPWWELIFFFGTFIGIVASILIPSLIVVFGGLRRMEYAFFLFANAFLIGPFVAFIGMSVALKGRGISWNPAMFLQDAYVSIVAFVIGNIVATILLFSVTKVLGFGFVRIQAEDDQAAVSSESA